MIKGIIFDYDGTIAQTLERQEQWFKHWSRENQKAWPFQDYGQFRNFYNHHCQEGGHLQVYRALDLPCEHSREHPVWRAYEEFKKHNSPRIYPGVKEVLQYFFEEGNLNDNIEDLHRVRIGLNTSNSWRSVGKELHNFGLLGYFDSRVTEEVLRKAGNGNPSHFYKPSTFSIALMLNLLDTKADETIHIGDTLSDLVCSHQVVRREREAPDNLVTIGVTYGFEGRENLEQGVNTTEGKIYFNHLVDRPQELIPLFKKIQGSYK